MDRYVITSSRVGEIGKPFLASPSDDIDWLLAGGFIQHSDNTSTKGAKLAKKPDANPSEQE